MSVTLKLPYVEGIRLRQQMATNVSRTVDGAVIGGKEWKFESKDVEREQHPRLVGPDGKKVPLDHYIVYVTAGLRNLVIERKGKVAAYDFHNTALRNQLRIKYQKLVPVIDKKGEPQKTKEGKPIMEWKDDGQPQYVPPNTFSGAYVGDGQRAVIDEMPT